MTRARKLVLIVAGVLVAARFFVPISECTFRNPAGSRSYGLPRFIPWNYEHFYPSSDRNTPDVRHAVYTRDNGKWRPGPRAQGSYTPDLPEVDIPDGSMAFWNSPQWWSTNYPGLHWGTDPRIGWTVFFPRPDFLTRLLTLDPGGYWETTCGRYTQQVLFGATLLHVLGIATIAGVVFVILPRSLRS